MYARSTTIRGNPQAMDDEIAYVRNEVMPALEQMSGCVGSSMLGDRESGHCIITSAWADETSMHASEQSVIELRQRAGEIVGGQPEAQVWEIAVMHRRHGTHHGACARVLWATGDPARTNDNLETFRMTMLSRLEDLPGFCSVSLMLDRPTGRSCVTVNYDSREDMRRGADEARAMREEFSSSAGVQITDMAEFDVVLAHLRVPETV